MGVRGSHRGDGLCESTELRCFGACHQDIDFLYRIKVALPPGQITSEGGQRVGVVLGNSMAVGDMSAV